MSAAATPPAGLEPSGVWRHFFELLQRPRPSGHEAAAATYVLDTARARGLDARRDEAGNVLIEVPASVGCEAAPRVILQGHLDMVPACAPGVSHDFTRVPPEPVLDGSWLHARGTSLGADNGIGVALALALALEPALKHGPLRLIFTVEEETSMRGARMLADDALAARYLINLDSEESGALYLSCAGSCDARVSLGLKSAPADDLLVLQLKLSGLTGGHSGTDIHLGRANAIGLMALLLSSVPEVRLVELEGGTVRNALPVSAVARVALSGADLDKTRAALNETAAKLKFIHKDSDPGFTLEISAAPAAAKAACAADSLKALRLLASLPQGARRPCDLDPAVTDISCNLGLVKADDKMLEAVLMARALSEAGLDSELWHIKALAALCEGAAVSLENRHPCWSPRPAGRLAGVLNEAAVATTGEPLKLTAMHAGLECALFARRNPDLELASLGPDIRHPHSPGERLNVASVAAVWRLLTAALPGLTA